MLKIDYEAFLSRIYDDSPYFGQGRAKELEKFNKFYFDNIKEKNEPLLEFGSGTGMLTIPMARAGYKIDSVDISPYMQEILAEKLAAEIPEVSSNVNQILGDAIQFNASQPYGSIIMPEGILIAIPDATLQIQLLESCYRNLRPGGRIYTDFFQPRYKVIYNKTVSEHTRFRTSKGDLYLMNINYDNDEYTQVQNWKVIYKKIENGTITEEIEANATFRYLFYSEVQLMLKQTGFKVIDIDTDYAEGRGFSIIGEKI